MEGLLITMLMFAVSIAALIIDKRTKAGRSVPQVNAEPIDFSEYLPAEEEGIKAIVRKEAAKRAGDIAAQTAAAQRAAEPFRTMQGHGPESRPASEPERPEKPEGLRQERPAKPNPTAEVILRDRKKLILYSEILKPKFDEGD